MFLITILILFFIGLITYQIFLANIKEGLENQQQPSYEPYPEDVYILSKQNAANIEFLKGRVDDLTKIEKTVKDLSLNVADLNTQVEAISKQQKSYINSVNNGKPVSISGVK